MITALAASPSLDVTYIVADYRLGGIHRPESVIRVAGGKTLNAARAATLLGADVHTIALLGGSLGAAVLAGAERDGVSVHPIATESETRACVSVSSLASGALTEVYEHPSIVTTAEWTAALEAVVTALRARPGWLLISGGMPASLGTDALAGLLAAAAETGVHVALDSHGAALVAALETAAPALLKINRAEAAEALGLAVDTPLIELARALHRTTQNAVVITDGVGGAIGVDAGGAALHVSLDGHTGAFPVGSGDSFLGALVVALDAGESLAYALRGATAAGAANAGGPGAAVFSRADYDALLPAVRLIPIAPEQ